MSNTAMTVLEKIKRNAGMRITQLLKFYINAEVIESVLTFRIFRFFTLLYLYEGFSNATTLLQIKHFKNHSFEKRWKGRQNSTLNKCERCVSDRPADCNKKTPYWKHRGFFYRLSRALRSHIILKECLVRSHERYQVVSRDKRQCHRRVCLDVVTYLFSISSKRCRATVFHCFRTANTIHKLWYIYGHIFLCLDIFVFVNTQEVSLAASCS